MAAVSSVQEEAVEGGWAEQGAVVRGVVVLTGLLHPGSRVAIPDLLPEWTEPGQGVVGDRVEQAEGEVGVWRNVLERLAGRGAGLGPERVGTAQARPPVGGG